MTSISTNHILLIEDNPLDIILIERYLEERSRQYVLHVEGTLAKGLTTLEKQPIDLVLLDLSLPDSSGFRTLTTFLAKVKGIPVIVLTGTNNEIIGDQAVKAGAEDYLIKGDFDGKSLLRSVRYAQQRHRAKSKLEKARNRLARNEDRYRHAEQLMHFGYLEMDLVSNQMKWSDELFRIFGLSPQSFTPTLSDYLNFVAPQERSNVKHYFETAPVDGTDHQLHHRIILEGKRFKTLSLFARTRYEKDTQQFSLAAAVLDRTHTQPLPNSTEAPHYIQDIRQTENKEFLSQIGFLVRTPLTSALQWSFLLGAQNLPEPADQYLKDLNASLHDLSVAVRSLLNLSLMQTEEVVPEEESFHLDHLLNNLEALFSGLQIGEFHWKKPTNPIGILKGDVARITHVVYCLGQFSLSDPPDDAPFISVDIQPQGSSLWLNFGFPLSAQSARDLKRLVPGKTSVTKGQSGLAGKLSSLELTAQLALQLTQSLGGTFQFFSARSAKGRQISIALPVIAPPRSSEEFTQLMGRTIHILIVEDHSLNRIAIRRALETWDVQVHPDTVEDGQTALQHFDHTPYDLVLLDLKLPDSNGWEIAKKMKKIRPVSIIAMSANRDPEKIDASQSTVFDAFLNKPFYTEELYAVIKKTLP